MNITGEKVTVNKSAEEVYTVASEPIGYKNFMPENLDKFEVNEDGFVFALKGSPEIALKIQEKVPNSKVVLVSAKDSLNIDLTLLINSLSETSSEVQFVFNGQFNMFISAMVEKPLKNLINSLTENISKL